MKYDLDLFNGIHTCVMCPLSEVRIAGGQIAAPAQPGAAYEAGGICIMAEAPRDEDVAPGAGYPMGSHTRTGKMLDLLLERAGLHRSALLTMLRVRCAPPRGRIKDHEDAIANCDTWTQQEFASYAPGLVVLMGALAMAPIYGKEAGVGRTRGVLASKGDKHPWGARQYIATYHPAAAILADGKAESEVAQMIVKDLRTARSLWLHGVTPF